MRLSSIIATAVLVATSVDALYTPRAHLHARHAKAIRAAQPIAEPEPAAEPLARPSEGKRRKRRDGKCKPRPSSAASGPTAVPVNVAPAPSSSSQPPKPKDDPKPAPAPAPAPPPAPKPAPAPAPAPKPAPKPAPAPAPAPAPPSSGGGGPFGSFFAGVNMGGDGTFYTPGLGACGFTNNESELVAAVPFGLWDAVPGYTGGNPNNNPICGKFIKVSYQGKSVRCKVVDECMGCNIKTSVDMSPAAFNQIADPSVGRIHNIQWTWD